jgi:hypothetical protein
MSLREELAKFARLLVFSRRLHEKSPAQAPGNIFGWDPFRSLTSKLREHRQQDGGMS